MDYQYLLSSEQYTMWCKLHERYKVENIFHLPQIIFSLLSAALCSLGTFMVSDKDIRFTSILTTFSQQNIINKLVKFKNLFQALFDDGTKHYYIK